MYEHPKGSRIWWCQYFANGKRHRERVGSRSDAIKLYQKRKTQILIGEKLPELQRKRVTFADVLDAGVAYAREHNKTASQYVQRADLFRPAFGARAAGDVTADELAAWIRKRGLAGSSFNRYKAFLSLCFREAIRSGLVKENTARQLAQKREPRGRQRFLSRPEYDRVLALIRQRHPERARDFIVSIHTGMRLSEQYGLVWRQLDFARAQIDLDDTKNGEDRSIPMNTVVVEALRTERTRGAADAVFPRPRGGKGSIKPRWFEAILRDAGIEDYTWHNNRHTFCSWLAIAGVPLKTIQELAGHKTIAITARYAHLSPDHKSREIEKLTGQVPSKLPESGKQSKRGQKSSAAA